MSESELFLPPEWKPHDYQVRGVEWLLTHPEGALFLVPGMGKTSITLSAILKLKEMGYPARALVLAPLRVAQATWRAEARKWLQFSNLRIGLAHGPDKAEILANPRYDVVLLNYDGLDWACKQMAQEHTFQILVADELTKLKHTNTKRFKSLKALLPTFQFRWGLTGTPAANGLLDLFGQVYVLDLGYRLGRFITHYRLKYFHQTPYDKWTWHISPRAAAQIHGKVADLAMYINPDEVLKLPPISHIQLPVQLTDALLRQYRQLETIAIMELAGKTLTAANAAVLTGKLRQFASGAIYVDGEDGRIAEEIHTLKLDALDDLIEELAGEPLLLAYNYTHELNRVLERHPGALVIRGGMSGVALDKVLAAWNDGTTPLLCAQSDAIAHGLNLQTGGSAVCWFSQTYNLEVYSQLIARVYRQGQTSHVRIYHLIAEKTIDQLIQMILGGKDLTQSALFAALYDGLVGVDFIGQLQDKALANLTKL